jgi:hypothetical protein
MAERYIRPPVVGTERPASGPWAVWRFRILLVLLFAALVAGVVLLVAWFVGGNNEGSPGIGAPARAAVISAPR